MGQKEKSLTKKIISEMDTKSERLFRINAGDGYVGKIIRGASNLRRFVMSGAPELQSAIAIIHPRILHAAPKGWADLAGWKKIRITPDMVGQEIAVFRMIEVKATGTLSKEQRIMRDLVQSMGGIFEVRKN